MKVINYYRYLYGVTFECWEIVDSMDYMEYLTFLRMEEEVTVIGTYDYISTSFEYIKRITTEFRPNLFVK